MKEEFANKLERVLSNPRVQGYQKHLNTQLGKDPRPIETYTYYIWNTALSNSLYAPLQAIEVALRNTIHNNASIYFKSDSWYDDPKILTGPTQKDKLKEAKASLIRHKKTVKPSRVVAELSFGFWTSLFNKMYEIKLWHPLIKKTFPYMPNHIRTRATLSARFNNIRALRNRVFHFEPIWHYWNLKNKHAEILEAIGWIEPAMKDLISSIDSFPAACTNGKISEIDQQIRRFC